MEDHIDPEILFPLGPNEEPSTEYWVAAFLHLMTGQEGNTKMLLASTN